MYHSQDLLVQLYRKTRSKYLKLNLRFKKKLQAKSKSNEILRLHSRLKKLQLQLQKLHLQIKLGLAAGAVSLFLNTGEVKAQGTIGPFEKKSRIENPLRDPISVRTPSIALVDLDNDGDLDLVVGDNSYNPFGASPQNSHLRFFENVGDNTKPLYIESDKIQLPVISFGSFLNVAFADIDEDGDLDLFLTFNSSSVLYYRNNDGSFEEQVGPWNPATKQGNPFHDISDQISDGYRLHFVDFDDDGDDDVFLSINYDNQGYGNPLKYLENTGNGVFDFSQENNSFNTSPALSGYITNVYVVDLDKDGDLDLVVGSNYSNLRYFAQNSSGQFIEQVGGWDPIGLTGNPFFNTGYNNFATPVLVDLNGDGELDLILGEGGGNKYDRFIIRYYENQGNLVLSEKKFLSNPFDGARFRYKGFPAFIDVDNDGDLDLIIGGKYDGVDFGVLWYYEKTENGFEYRKGATENPFFEIIPSGFAHSTPKPTIVDIDGDGFDDIVIGTRDFLRLIKNNGNGTFSLIDQGDDPFDVNALTFNLYSSVAFIDIDNDGDLDLFLSLDDYVILLRNQGTTENPNFVEDPSYNGLPSLSLNGFLHLQAIDLDNDGFDDLLISDLGNNNIYTLLNRGDESFTELSSTQNPFYSSIVGTGVAPTFIDLDEDGDLDVFVALQYEVSIDYFLYGILNYIKNENPVPEINFITSEKDYPESGGTVLTLDESLELSDADSDDILEAIIRIENYIEPQGGNVAERLSFTPNFGIDGSFDEDLGELRLSGRASVDEYQSVLRSVGYEMLVPEDVKSGGSGQRTINVPREISFLVVDQDRTIGTPAAYTINIIFSNEAPVLSATSVNASFVFGQGPVSLAPDIVVSDADDPTLFSAEVRITSATFRADDQLVFTDGGVVAGNYDAGSGILSLSGEAELSAYQNILRSVQFNSVSSNPELIDRIIEFTVNDGEDDSNTISITLSVSVTSNEAPVLSSAATSVAYTVGGSPVVVAPDIEIADADDTQLQSAIARITSASFRPDDELSFTLAGGVVGLYNETTGILSFTGEASLSIYEDILRSVVYTTSATSPDLNDRVIEFQVNDGTDDSNVISIAVTLTVIPNQPPVLSSTTTAINYTVNGSPEIVAADISISDADDTELQNASVRISPASFRADDELQFTLSGGVAGNYDVNTGILSLNGAAELAVYQDILRSVSYSNNATSPDLNDRVIEFQVNDGTDDSNILIVTVTLNIINVPPTLSSSFNAAERLYSTGQEIVDPTISIEDPDNTQMTSATVRISQGYISGQDVLSLQATGNITASFNSINGTLTLSGAEEISVYQTALRNVSYENTSTSPNTSTRTISFTINDGIDESNTLNVAVNFNLPPVIQAIFQPTRTGNLVIIDLTSLISDPNNNLDISTLQIVSPPISGASASINSNNQLAIDYTGINFSGTDRLSIRVCDNLGACTIQELSFQIEGEIVVYNGISPNNDGRNDYLEIINLPAENKVSIFNRWGDLVYDIENYNNTTRRFEGIGNSGNELPNGVYFYKIEFKNGSSTLTGFLTIKR